MKKLIILGHINPDVDSIVSGYLLSKYLNKKGIDSEFVIPDKRIDNYSLDVCLKYGLDPRKFQKPLPKESSHYILVDHNNREVNGKIVGIIDHHPTFKEINIKYYYNKNISSTTCLICQGNEKFFTDNDLKLALIAAMIDTASFHSSKGREKDKKWIKEQCQIRNIDYGEIYKEGLALTSLKNLKKAALNGLKSYQVSGINFESSYIQVANESPKVISKIINYLEKYRKDKNLVCFVFIVHNMNRFVSKVYLLSDNGIQTKTYNEYTSRGDKIIPDVLKLIKKHGIL